MATVIYTTTESKLEDAWSGYLADADGLEDVSVAPYSKALETATYPAVAVRALGSESLDNDLRVERFDVELTVYTEALPDKDADCSYLYSIVGAIRNAIVVPQANTSLTNEVDGLSVKAIIKYTIEYEQLISSSQDDTLLDKRFARIVVTQWAISFEQAISL